MKKVVITGATSMLALALINELVKEDCKIYAVCRNNSSRKDRIPINDKIVIVESDLENLDELSVKIPEACDLFYHFAWKESGLTRNDNLSVQISNIEYTLNAVRIAKVLGCMRFIGAGSQAEYGNQTEKITEQTPETPVTPYGICKFSAGHLSKILCERLGISHIWVRIFSVYGKNDRKDTMLMNAIHSLKNGEAVAFTEGIQLWDYLYEKDAGKALLLIGDYGKDSNIYNLASGCAKPLREYIKEIGRTLNTSHLLRIGDLSYSSDKIYNLYADIAKLKEDVGFIPEYSFSDGLREII